MVRKSKTESQSGQPILSYTSSSTREVELPAETVQIFEDFAKFYNQFSGMKITGMDVLSSKGMELFRSPKSLSIDPYKPPVKQSITLPDGAWSGLDKAAKECQASERDAIIAVAKNLANDEQFNSWIAKKKNSFKRKGASIKSSSPKSNADKETANQH